MAFLEGERGLVVEVPTGERTMDLLELVKAAYQFVKAEIVVVEGIGKLIVGLFVIIGLVLTRKRIKVTEEGQVTERFTRAVDQLGHRKPDVRVGGIYALERIARDSAKDHWTVMEVLTAYIREHAPWKGNEQQKDKAEEEVPMLSTDVQAAMAVIGRRKWTGKEGKDQFLNLYEVDIRRAYLMGAHLERAFLMYAHLEGAILEGADLRDATGLTQEQINSAFGDNDTKLPEGLQAPSSWLGEADKPATDDAGGKEPEAEE